MKTGTPTETREQILNAAERLFAISGFTGTSLRAVTRAADVNLAAVHYHFGSKEELFRVIVKRIAEPIVQQQLQGLEALERSVDIPSIEQLIEAFVAPSVSLYRQITQEESEMCLTHAQFMGRCRTEPQPIQQIAEQEFCKSHERFLEMLQKVLPNQSPAELEWKLDLIIAMIIRVLNQTKPLELSAAEDTTQQATQVIQRLVAFITSGIGK
ncbi:MAG: TetR/AcrR family transcriptional regulator [Oscillatoriales cyanobacterium RM1_1_9]|nr:TetR/AcrR family transcriptional regulator [Oscillatoriales cyanobacterium RM2_1_1]NJO70716.1 TetR/AcrR family transcriptional regulator [Oscillatoriales cyanobacterium RM1_1_9]